MTIDQAVALVLVGLSSIHVWSTLTETFTLLVGCGRRVKRLGLRRLGQASIHWQASCGVALILLREGTGATAVLGMAGLWWLGLWTWDRGFGEPWWAPGADA